MASPTIYKWTDPSAPQIKRGNVADYQNLFQKVLVDGYGSKTAAGWTIPFADASGFIIKQGGTSGIKSCLKLHNFNSIGYYCKMEAAEDYTDFTTPVNQFDGFEINDRLSIGYATTTSYHIPWTIFATATTIYMFFGYNGQQIDTTQFDTVASPTVFRNYHGFFGNYIPFEPTALRKTISIHHITAATQETQVCNALTSSNTSYSSKNVNSAGSLVGSFSAQYLIIKSQNSTAIDIGTASIGEAYPVYPNPTDGSLYLDNPKLLVDNAIVGKMAGMLYTPATRAFPITNKLYTFAGSGDYTGQTIHVINTYNGQFYLHDGDWGVE